MTNLLWPVGFAAEAVVLVAWFVLTHVFSRPIAHFVASTFLGRGSSMALSEAVAKKIVYGVAVVFLFTYAYVWRSVVVDPAGKEASVRGKELGDVHLTRLARPPQPGRLPRGHHLLPVEPRHGQADEEPAQRSWRSSSASRHLTDLQPHFQHALAVPVLEPRL